MTEYRPGVCNIGHSEQRKRYALGLASTAVAVLLTGLLALDMMPVFAIGGVLIASFLAFEGFLQGYLSFCVGFASKGIYDTSESGGEREEVEDENSRKKDKVRALQIHMYSLTGAITVTAFIYLGLTVL